MRLNTYVNFAGKCADAFRFSEKHLVLRDPIRPAEGSVRHQLDDPARAAHARAHLNAHPPVLARQGRGWGRRAPWGTMRRPCS